MIKGAKRRGSAFIVRIWHEEERSSRWRASVMHLASGEVRYFTNYGDLCEFLDRWTDAPPTSTH
jgi:hypothetical protein